MAAVARAELRLVLVDPELVRDEAREHRRVPGADADLADDRAGGDLVGLALVDLALGGEDLRLELVGLVGHG